MPRTEAAQVTADWRDRVVVFLAFLTSPECAEVCKRHAGSEELAAALTRLWFDAVYVPGDSYMDSMKGQRAETEVTQFNACFAPQELESLERFHGFFELRLSFVTNSIHGRGFFPDNDSWQSILKHASYVLAELDPDPDAVRRIIASLAKQPPGQLLSSLGGRALTEAQQRD